MIRFKQIIAFIILVIFVINSTVYGAPIYDNGARHTLSTISIFSTLKGIQHKDIGRMKLSIEAYLKLASNNAKYIDDALLSNLRKITATAKENTLFHPANMQFFFTGMQELPNGYVSVMCRIKDKKFYSREKTYYAVFSRNQDDLNGFPVEVYTEDEYDYEKIKEAIASTNQLPRRKGADEEAIRNYMEHERSPVPGKLSLDEWIAKKMEAGNYAIADDFYRLDPYRRTARFQFSLQEHYRLIASTLTTLEQLGVSYNSIKELREMLLNKPIILLYREPNEDLPQVTMQTEDGLGSVPVDVYSHSSDNAVYIILNKNSFRNILPDAIHGHMDTVRPGQGVDTRIIKEEKSCVDIILDRLFYEASVHLGIRGSVREDGQLTNILTKALDRYNLSPISYNAETDIVKLKPVSSLSETLLTRDYAQGNRPSYKNLVTDTIASSLQVSELKWLIQTMEQYTTGRDPNKKWSKAPSETRSDKRLIRLGDVLTYRRIQHDIPNRLPKTNEIGGLFMLQEALKVRAQKIALLTNEALSKTGGSNRRESARHSLTFYGSDALAVLYHIWYGLKSDTDQWKFCRSALRQVMHTYLERQSTSDANCRISNRILDATRPIVNAERRNARVGAAIRKLSPPEFAMAVQVLTLALPQTCNAHSLFTDILDGIIRRTESSDASSRQGDSEKDPDYHIIASILPAHSEPGLPLEAFVKRIDAMWKTTGNHVYTPFSKQAQAMARQILVLDESRVNMDYALSSDTYFKLLYAHLYADANYEAVLSFFEFVKGLDESYNAFREEVFTTPAFLTLYFVARLMDPRSVAEAKRAEQPFFVYYAQHLLGPDTDIAEIFGPLPGDVASMASAVVDSIHGFIGLFLQGERREYDKALALVDNCLEYLQDERNLGESGLGDTAIDNLLSTRQHIKKERDESRPPEATALQGGPLSGDDARQDIEALKPFDEVFKASGEQEGLRKAYDRIVSKIDEYSALITKKYKDDAISTNKIGIVPRPRGKEGYTFVVLVNPEAKARQIGIYQSFVENIAYLEGLIVPGDYSETEQQKMIDALITGAVLHELGHGFEGFSHLDLYSLVNDKNAAKYYTEYAELVGIKGVPEDMAERQRFAEAVADMYMAGLGGKHYVDNKAAYLFYKYVMRDPVKYAANNGAIASLVNSYFERNPYFQIPLEFGPVDIENIAQRVSYYHNLFFGKGTRWHNDNARSLRHAEEALTGTAKPVDPESEQIRAQIKGFIHTIFTDKPKRTRDEARHELTKIAYTHSELVMAELNAVLADKKLDKHSRARIKITITMIQRSIANAGWAAARQGDGENDPDDQEKQHREYLAGILADNLVKDNIPEDKYDEALKDAGALLRFYLDKATAFFILAEGKTPHPYHLDMIDMEAPVIKTNISPLFDLTLRYEAITLMRAALLNPMPEVSKTLRQIGSRRNLSTRSVSIKDEEKRYIRAYAFYYAYGKQQDYLDNSEEIRELINEYKTKQGIMPGSPREKEIREQLNSQLREIRAIVAGNPNILDSPLPVGGFSETKQGERRTGIIPHVINVLDLLGIKAYTQSGMGVTGGNGGSRFKDEEYRKAGAVICNSQEEVFRQAHVLQHIKELQNDKGEEESLARANAQYGRRIVFNFNHFAQSRQRTIDAINSGSTFVSFENVATESGKPILHGPSEKAGINAAYHMALYLLAWDGIATLKTVGLKDKNAQERVKQALKLYDMHNIPPTPNILPDRDLTDFNVIVYGGGVVGYHQARELAKMGAKVSIIERSRDRITYLEHEFQKQGLEVTVIDSRDKIRIESALKAAHGISTAAYVQGQHAQHLITKNMLARIGTGKVFTVVDIDQGGGIEGARATSHKNPAYMENGNLYYCVPNAPANVPRQTSIDVSLATFKYLAVMSLYGLEKAVEIYPELAYAIDVAYNRITNPVIQQEFPNISENMQMRTDPDKMIGFEIALAVGRARVDAKEAARGTETMEGIPTRKDEQYTLLVDNNIYRDKDEYEKDIAGYMLSDGRCLGAGDRFNLKSVNTADVDNILAHIKDPKRTIVQISNSLSIEDVMRLLNRAPGIRIINVDTKDFKYDKELTDDARRDCRFDIYAMMLAARRITKEDIASQNSIYRVLSFMINTHFKDGSQNVAPLYIEALINVSANLDVIIKTNLSYKPIRRWNIPSYKAVSATLISA